jgi:hypothetical protein
VSRSTLIAEYTREAQNPDYTIDAVIVLEDDLAYAIGYDAATSEYLILEGARQVPDRGICYAPSGGRYPFLADALKGITRVAEGDTLSQYEKAAPCLTRR